MASRGGGREKRRVPKPRVSPRLSGPHLLPTGLSRDFILETKTHMCFLDRVFTNLSIRRKCLSIFCFQACSIFPRRCLYDAMQRLPGRFRPSRSGGGSQDLPAWWWWWRGRGTVALRTLIADEPVWAAVAAARGAGWRKEAFSLVTLLRKMD